MIARYRPDESNQSKPGANQQSAQLERLCAAISKAAELLPTSGPITSFAFLNTLQALENLSFEEGIERGATLFGCQPWLPEESYRLFMANRRIDAEDLATVLYESLREEGAVPVGGLCSRYDFRLAMLKYSLPAGSPEELRWYLDDSQALTRFRQDTSAETKRQLRDETRQWLMTEVATATEKVDPSADPYAMMLADLARELKASELGYWTKSDAELDAICLQSLWRICTDQSEQLELSPVPKRAPLRVRDLLFDATGEDSDLLVHETLIRFCAAFTDQGLADWPLPGKEEGFYQAFLQLYRDQAGLPNHWMQSLAGEIDRLTSCQIDPLESIRESLSMLGYSEEEWPEVMQATLLALPGWAGLIRHMEVRADRFAFPAPSGTLLGYLAIRLILERQALAHLSRNTPFEVSQLNQLRGKLLRSRVSPVDSLGFGRAFAVFQLAQLLRWSPPRLSRLSADDWKSLVEEVEAFGNVQRRQLLHRAYERHFECQVLDALWSYGQRATTRLAAPGFQAAFCIDAREESFRRHIEEVGQNVETFGVAGFFGVPMYYRGVADAHFVPLCPIVIKPGHWVTEEVVYPLGDAHRRRSNVRRLLGTAAHRLHMSSRGVAHGAVVTAGLGVLASVPLIARVLFPRATGRVRSVAGRIARAPSMTRLRLHRSEAEPGPENGHIGFTTDEMANLAERTLREIGLTYGFARLVVFFGHGSTSVNNPHKSVYDCGACTGNPGGPNARALAAMLNDGHVRNVLARRGVEIPRDTYFLGGMHNTSDDSVAFFDLQALPASHIGDFEELKHVLAEACNRNAHERCRRFDSAPLSLSFSAAKRHVEERSMDLVQARPEFGNASNAMCIVGRRQRSHGLFLDRRSFLMSYDPAQDDAEFNILERILNAVVPVCEGINMQYFLSSIDSSGWGCGSKLPHNITSLLGIMDGAASDLRSGLPWQGVEIHEPMRLLFVVETTPEAMRKIMQRNQAIGRILRNGWARLAVLSPTSNNIVVYTDGEFRAYEPSAAQLRRPSRRLAGTRDGVTTWTLP